MLDAFASVLATTNARTPDLGGDATTKELRDGLAAAGVRSTAPPLADGATEASMPPWQAGSGPGPSTKAS